MVQTRNQWDDIHAAGRFSDGTLVALDRNARQVKAYDESGHHLWTTGREGRGPGEFRFPWAMWIAVGDSVVVSDPGNGRFTVLARDGSIAREVALSATDGLLLAHGQAGTGKILVETRRPEMTELGGYAAMIMNSTLRLVDPSGEPMVDLGTHELIRQIDVDVGSFTPPLFGEAAVFIGSSAGVWYAYGSSYELSLLGEGGDVARRVHWDGPDRSITTADVQRLREVSMSAEVDDPDMRPILERYYQNQPVSDKMAAFSRFLIDEVGRLWVQDYIRPDRPDDEAAWLILSSNGERVLGRLTHTFAFQPMAAGENWVLGAGKDALGVEYLQLRGLRSVSPGGS